jgi:beta-galactosidase
VDRKLAGTVDRRLGQTSLSLDLGAGKFTLDVLVENTGRINFGQRLPDGRAGIVNAVSLAGRTLSGWKMYSLPMKSPDFIRGWKKGQDARPSAGPAFHRGWFTLDRPADSFLDTSALGKGFIWVNGHNLGRTWDIGPQKSLYLPAAWLHTGRNEVVVFDYTDLRGVKLRGLSDPLWSTSAEAH